MHLCTICFAASIAKLTFVVQVVIGEEIQIIITFKSTVVVFGEQIMDHISDHGPQQRGSGRPVCVRSSGDYPKDKRTEGAT